MAQTTDNPRPNYCTEEHLENLDALDEAGTGSRWLLPGLRLIFPELSRKEAQDVIEFWRNDADWHSKPAGGTQ